MKICDNPRHVDISNTHFSLEQWRATKLNPDHPKKLIINVTDEACVLLHIQLWSIPRLLQQYFSKDFTSFFHHFFDDLVIDSEPKFTKFQLQNFSAEIVNSMAFEVMKQFTTAMMNEG